MILDKQNELSNAQPITGSAASTNQIDQGPAAYTGNARGTAYGQIFLNVDADFVGPGGSTLQVGLRSSPNADMSGAVTHILVPPIPVASLKRGASMRKLNAVLPVPENVQRYLDVFYTVAGGPFTGGALSARYALETPNSVGA